MPYTVKIKQTPMSKIERIATANILTHAISIADALAKHHHRVSVHGPKKELIYQYTRNVLDYDYREEYCQ